MATSTRFAGVKLASAPAGTAAVVANPLIAWHLLSLDAPTVAMLWTWFIAATNHIRLPNSAILAMGFAVWILYAADRLLDGRPSGSQAKDLEARHLFHHLHRRAFRFGITIASVTLAFLVFQLPSQSIRLYAILGTLLFGYFVLIHVAGGNGDRAARFSKEIAVGVFFSAAAFIPTVARNPELRVHLLPAALLFSLLCSLNCLFIYAWEHPASYPRANAHFATRLALLILPALSIAAILAALALALISRLVPWQIPTAIAAAAALLLLLHLKNHKLAPTTLRASADLCLLTPLLLIVHLPH